MTGALWTWINGVWYDSPHANRIAAISGACLQPGADPSAGLVLRRACTEDAEADAEARLRSLLLLRLDGSGYAMPSTGLDEAEQMPLFRAARHDVGCDARPFRRFVAARRAKRGQPP